MQEKAGYADSGQIMSVEFDRKIIIYWWLMANFGLLMSFIGIPLMLFWVPFGWIIHQKQYEHMSGALTNRSLNMRMGWLFKKQQNIDIWRSYFRLRKSYKELSWNSVINRN